MATDITFTFYGDTQIDRTLERLTVGLGDARPAWEKMADRFGQVERRQFDSEGAVSGAPWSPLSPPYAAWKLRHYGPKPILVRTGRLRRTLTGRPFGVEVIEPQHMVVGSDVGYGLFHQHGTGRMPRRRPIDFDDAERNRWVKIMQAFVHGLLEGNR